MSYSQFTELGKLELIDTYEFYDRPLLFSCRNTADHLFIAVLVNEKEFEETWYYVGVSQPRFQQISSGLIDLHDAFSQSEDGIIYEVLIYSGNGKNSDFKAIPSSSISEKYLPLAGEKLSVKTQTLPRLENNLARKASQTKRQYVRLKLDLPNMYRTEAPANLLGEVFISFQELINFTADSMKEVSKIKGHIPTEMLVLNVGHSSFEVEFASSDIVDLFDESYTGKAIEQIINLINLGGDTDKLKEQLTNLKMKVANKYRIFLKSFSDAITDVQLEWATPKERNTKIASISARAARDAIKIIQQTEIEPPKDFNIIGKLVGANLRSKTYEIWTEANKKKGKKYAGLILDEAMETVRGAILDKKYSATIRQTIKINLMTGEPDDKFHLVKLESA